MAVFIDRTTCRNVNFRYSSAPRHGPVDTDKFALNTGFEAEPIHSKRDRSVQAWLPIDVTRP